MRSRPKNSSRTQGEDIPNRKQRDTYSESDVEKINYKMKPKISYREECRNGRKCKRTEFVFHCQRLENYNNKRNRETLWQQMFCFLLINFQTTTIRESTSFFVILRALNVANETPCSRFSISSEATLENKISYKSSFFRRTAVESTNLREPYETSGSNKHISSLQWKP